MWVHTLTCKTWDITITWNCTTCILNLASVCGHKIPNLLILTYISYTCNQDSGTYMYISLSLILVTLSINSNLSRYLISNLTVSILKIFTIHINKLLDMTTIHDHIERILLLLVLLQKKTLAHESADIQAFVTVKSIKFRLTYKQILKATWPPLPWQPLS